MIYPGVEYSKIRSRGWLDRCHSVTREVVHRNITALDVNVLSDYYSSIEQQQQPSSSSLSLASGCAFAVQYKSGEERFKFE